MEGDGEEDEEGGEDGEVSRERARKSKEGTRPTAREHAQKQTAIYMRTNSPLFTPPNPLFTHMFVWCARGLTRVHPDT